MTDSLNLTRLINRAKSTGNKLEAPIGRAYVNITNGGNNELSTVAMSKIFTKVSKGNFVSQSPSCIKCE